MSDDEYYDDEFYDDEWLYLEDGEPELAVSTPLSARRFSNAFHGRGETYLSGIRMSLRTERSMTPFFSTMKFSTIFTKIPKAIGSTTMNTMTLTQRVYGNVERTATSRD